MFDPLVDRKQAVWLYGPPDSGKSQIGFILQKLSKSYAILGASDYLDKNFKAQLLNRRVGIIQEAAAAFIRHDIFKSLTGDGTHSINQKYAPVFNAELPILLFAFSNDEPQIPNDESLKRRIIACKMSSLPEGKMRTEGEIQKALLAELPNIIGACLAEYALLEPGSRIPAEDDDLSEAVDSFEEIYSDWLQRHIYEDPQSSVSMAQLNQLLKADGITSNLEVSRYKRVLMSRYKAKKCQQYGIVDGRPVRIWIYKGISLRSCGKLVPESVSFISEDDQNGIDSITTDARDRKTSYS